MLETVLNLYRLSHRDKHAFMDEIYWRSIDQYKSKMLVDIEITPDMADIILRTYGIDIDNKKLDHNCGSIWRFVTREEFDSFKMTIARELLKYPVNVIRRIGIRKIYAYGLTDNTDFSKSVTLASSNNKLLASSHSFECSLTNLIHVFHHEIFHLIIFRTGYPYNILDYQKMIKNFGLSWTYLEGKLANIRRIHKYFATREGRRNYEDDLAEFAAVCMASYSSFWVLIKRLDGAHGKILNTKIDVVQKLYKRIGFDVKSLVSRCLH